MWCTFHRKIYITTHIVACSLFLSSHSPLYVTQAYKLIGSKKFTTLKIKGTCVNEMVEEVQIIEYSVYW